MLINVLPDLVVIFSINLLFLCVFLFCFCVLYFFRTMSAWWHSVLIVTCTFHVPPRGFLKINLKLGKLDKIHQNYSQLPNLLMMKMNKFWNFFANNFSSDFRSVFCCKMVHSGFYILTDDCLYQWKNMVVVRLSVKHMIFQRAKYLSISSNIVRTTIIER